MLPQAILAPALQSYYRLDSASLASYCVLTLERYKIPRSKFPTPSTLGQLEYETERTLTSFPFKSNETKHPSLGTPSMLRTMSISAADVPPPVAPPVEPGPDVVPVAPAELGGNRVVTPPKDELVIMVTVLPPREAGAFTLTAGGGAAPRGIGVFAAARAAF
jgi:hypothetical protein